MCNSKFFLLASLCLFLLIVSVGSAEDKADPATAKIMEQKLRLSQAILAGVVKEDYPAISTNADRLLELAKVQWVRNETPEYREQLKDFWIVLEGVKSAAEDKSGDGVTLAYVQMTLTCVKCHKYLRSPLK